jgi:hypothetical protein
MARRRTFHPDMYLWQEVPEVRGGGTAIEPVAPAVWKAPRSPHSDCPARGRAQQRAGHQLDPGWPAQPILK